MLLSWGPGQIGAMQTVSVASARPAPLRITGCPALALLLIVFVLSPWTLRAAPAGITLAAPTLQLPARYILASDPARSNLVVEVSTVLNRNQLCFTGGNLLGPCAPQETSVRITVDIGTGGRPTWTAQKTVLHTVPGVAAVPITEIVEVIPSPLFTDMVEYTITVTLEHTDDPASRAYVHDQTRNFGPYRFAHFTGSIFFGDVAATLSGLAAEPAYLGNSEWSIHVLGVTAEEGGSAAHSVAAQPPLTVRRNSRGNLTVLTGELESAAAAAFQWAGWSGQRGRVLLGPQGWVTDALTLTLPPGIGWRPANERLLRPTFEITAARIPLNRDWQPIGPVSGTPALPMQFFADTYPVEFQSPTWTWRDGALILDTPGTRFVRRQHYADFQAGIGTGDIPESNDGFWFHLQPAAASNLSIRPGFTGGITVDLRLAAGEFFGHFPLCGVRAPAGGGLRIADNRVVPADSNLPGATTHVLYGQGCRGPDEAGALPLPTRGLQLAGVTLQFTPSAGLWAEGTLTAPAVDPAADRHLEIGRNAGVATHSTDPFTNGTFYLPGSWVPHHDGFDHPGDVGAAVDEPGEDPLAFNPARYLLSGLRRDQDNALEHPGTPAYLIGAADYAGMNLRHAAGLGARSRIGGVEVAPYPLAANAKYYARLGGVSGVHESADGPQALPAYGYDIDLGRFGLSFLDNAPHDSRINGSLHLPQPSGFSQAFQRLLLSCCGNLTEGIIDPADTEKQLAYWSATRIHMDSLRFSHDPNQPCATDQALLELGVTADIAHLDEMPSGFLYPRPDGSLVAIDTLDRESHLTLGSVVDLAGYAFSAVRRAYFNEHTAFPAGPGWLNVAGNAGVSFFRDLTIHGQILGSTATPPPPLVVKGGWSAGGDNFFNQAGFDEAHRGYPPGIDLVDYREGDTHLPHARQVWFGTVPFDYPVRFDPLTRVFRSPAPKGVDLVVLDTESELERLNAELADIRFSAFLDLSLLAAPELLVEEGASWITGHIEDAAVATLRNGLDRLAAILDAQMREMLDQVLLPAVEMPVVVPLANQVLLQPNPAAIDAALDQVFDTPFTDALQALADVAGTGVDLTDRAADALGAAAGTLETARQVLATLQQAEALIEAGLEVMGINLDELPDGIREEFLAELEQLPGEGAGAVGRLVEIREAIIELEAGLAQVIEALEEGEMFFAQLRDTVFTPVTEYAQIADDLKARLGTWLKSGVALDPGAYAVEELRARVRLEIRDAFAGSPVAANIQTVYRTWIYNSDSAVRQALDTAFQAINDQIVSVAMVALEEIEQAVQPVKSFSSVVESVNWDGRAQIRGDRLSLLRLDNRAIVNLPTPVPGVQVPVEFTGFYQFRELTSDGPVGCLAGVPGRANEILLGSSAGPASMFGGSGLSVESKFTRAEDGTLLLLAGGVEMDVQGPNMPAMGLEEFSATLSIGPAASEFYLSAFARGRFGVGNSEVGLAGGVLFGRTCSDAALSWDPEALGYLGGTIDPAHPFTGVYLFGEGSVPISSVGCLMNCTISAGVRAWATDPEFDFADVQVGGALEGGVSAEYLCLARIKGTATLTGSMQGGLYRYGGGVEVAGKLGICPICVEFGGSVQATHTEGSGWQVED